MSAHKRRSNLDIDNPHRFFSYLFWLCCARMSEFLKIERKLRFEKIIPRIYRQSVGVVNLEIRLCFSMRGECRWPRADLAVHPQNRGCAASNPLAFTSLILSWCCRAAHFPTCALQQTPFLGTKVPFPLDIQIVFGISSKFPRKGWNS